MDLIKGLSVAGTIAALPFHIAAYAVERKLRSLSEKPEGPIGKSSANAALPVRVGNTEKKIDVAMRQIVAKAETKITGFVASLHLSEKLETMSKKMTAVFKKLTNTPTPAQQIQMFAPSKNAISGALKEISDTALLANFDAHFTAHLEVDTSPFTDALWRMQEVDSPEAKQIADNSMKELNKLEEKLNEFEKRLNKVTPKNEKETNELKDAQRKIKDEHNKLNNEKDLIKVTSGLLDLPVSSISDHKQKVDDAKQNIKDTQKTLKELLEHQQNLEGLQKDDRAFEDKNIHDKADNAIKQLNLIQETLNGLSTIPEVKDSANGLQMEITISLFLANSLKTKSAIYLTN